MFINGTNHELNLVDNYIPIGDIVVCRETVDSLAGYFAIFSFLSGFISIPFLADSQGKMLFMVLGGVSIGLALAFLYLSACLKKLLIESPQTVRTVIMLRVFLGIAMSLVPVLSGSLPLVSILRLVITLWVGWYLLKQAQLVSLKLRSQYRPPATHRKKVGSV